MNRFAIGDSEEVVVTALVKGAERYVVTYRDIDRAAVLRQLGRWASNPELTFTWYDAAVLSQKVRAGRPEGGEK